ncbi:alpha/beta hydrolase [Sphingomonas sp. SUN019]|uniref:alpha/beta fold hydrolase n=1 Tax=Sphingomonas sp. SUN019 TaxID=2937788 RepID=UPI002164451D|nr:alpha/beta hydrolase [Sphingomonas sp. SUN019]UVO52325.1 alpha/beta hydrolase [Sphingomonas sp. SUN019]
MRKFTAWAALILGLLFLALFIFRTPDTDPAAMRAKYAAPPSRFLDIGNGLTIHYRDTGPRNAPALILLHGSNASLHTWEPWAARLDKTYRVIRLDQIGHGLTGPNPTSDYTQRAFVKTLDRFTQKLGLTRFALAGNSMGGGVAWGYALAHPDNVSALILVDSVGQPEPDGGKAPLGFRIARIPVLRDLAAMVTPRRLIEDSLPGAFADPRLADDEQIDLYWKLLRYPGNRQATIDRFATPRSSATPEMLRRLKMPVLIEWGEKDALIPVSSARWLARAIPGSRLIVYPNTGHIPMEEAPDASARDAAAFLASVEPS